MTIVFVCSHNRLRSLLASEALRAKRSDLNIERAAGENAGRAEVLNAIWREQAIEGKMPSGTSASQPYYRRVWVPERVVNGVRFRAGYQTVLYYR